MTGFYRTFASDLEIRSGGDGRTVHGIAVPWNVTVRIDNRLTEEWLPGAFDHQMRAASRVIFSREHLDLGGQLIGRMIGMRNDARGLYVELRASKTPLADETLELMRDGALPDLSIGFNERPGGYRTRVDGVRQWTKADLFEVASTLRGQYGELASVTAVRSLSAGDDRVGEPEPAETPNLDLARRNLLELPAVLPNWTGV